MKYLLTATRTFEKRSSEIVKRNPQIKNKLTLVLETLSNNPFHIRLMTHKVISKRYGRKYSSRVSGDIRIIWNFAGKKSIVILLLDIGGHTGKRGVY